MVKVLSPIFFITIFVTSLNLSASPNSCSTSYLLDTYKKAYEKTQNADTAMRAVGSTLSDFYKADAALSRFIVNAANGELIKEIKTVTAVTTGYKIHPVTLKSSNLMDFYRGTELRGQPMASYLTTGFDRLGMIVSIINFADKLQLAISTGDKIANANAAKDAIDIATAVSLSYRGWQGLNIAFSAVGFIDYALNAFIKDAYAMYDEYWWQSYRSYLDAEYPKMVTGSQSWAALASRKDKGQAFQARLTEFWSYKGVGNDAEISTPMERAAHFYKKPSFINGSALAESMGKYKISFASRYYNEVLKTTLDTYFRNLATQLKFDAESKLKQSLNAFCAYKKEIKQLQLKVAQLKIDQDNENKEIALQDEELEEQNAAKQVGADGNKETSTSDKKDEELDADKGTISKVVDTLLSPANELLATFGFGPKETIVEAVDAVATEISDLGADDETFKQSDDIENGFGDVDEVSSGEYDEGWDVRQQVAENAKNDSANEEDRVASQQQELQDERERERAEFAAGMQVIAQGLGQMAVQVQQSNMELDQQLAANNAHYSNLLNSGSASKQSIDNCARKNSGGRYSDANAIRQHCAQQVSSSLNNNGNKQGLNTKPSGTGNNKRRPMQPKATRATRTYFKIMIKETGQAAGTFDALDRKYGIYRYADNKRRRYYSSRAIVSELEQYNDYRRQGKIEIKAQTEAVMLVDNCVVETRMYQTAIRKMTKMGISSNKQTWGGADCL